MSSSSSISSDICLKTLWDLVILGRLAIVSFEFTEMREKDSETLFQVEILLREAGSSTKKDLKKGFCDVEIPV